MSEIDRLAQQFETLKRATGMLSALTNLPPCKLAETLRAQLHLILDEEFQTDTESALRARIRALDTLVESEQRKVTDYREVVMKLECESQTHRYVECRWLPGLYRKVED
jgi:hypothetical protein